MIYTNFSIDAFITTKFTSVGDTIEIFANTKGHSGTLSNPSTIVTADILHFPDNDPLGIIVQGETPQNPGGEVLEMETETETEMETEGDKHRDRNRDRDRYGSRHRDKDKGKDGDWNGNGD